MKTTITLLIIGMILVTVTTTTTTTTTVSQTAAYGQDSAFILGEELTEEQEQMIIADLINKIQAYGNNPAIEPFVYLDDEGRMSLSYNNETSQTFVDDLNVNYPHNYTDANGYEFRGNEIIAPNGSMLFE